MSKLLFASVAALVVVFQAGQVNAQAWYCLDPTLPAPVDGDIIANNPCGDDLTETAIVYCEVNPSCRTKGPPTYLINPRIVCGTVDAGGNVIYIPAACDTIDDPAAAGPAQEGVGIPICDITYPTACLGGSCSRDYLKLGIDNLESEELNIEIFDAGATTPVIATNDKGCNSCSNGPAIPIISDVLSGLTRKPSDVLRPGL